MALQEGPWATIGEFFAARFPLVSAGEWRERMQAGDIVDQHGAPIDLGNAYRPHQKLWYYRTLPEEARIPFDETVLFQDEHLVVADKPHFLPVSPSGRYLQESLLVRLKRKLGIDTLSPIHRIDRGTAGLVLFSVQPGTRDRYQSLFRERSVTKRYEAIVPWRKGAEVPPVYRSNLTADPTFLLTRESPGAPNSETHLQLLEVCGAHARLALSPVTGRRHQLRVHCAALGMPIVYDDFYPVLLPEGSDDYARPLQLLAHSVAFRDPLSGAPRAFESARSLSFDTVSGQEPPTGSR
ncbi:pseudouridine synthase [Variovorax sp. J22R133]|uniref:pseudouridine synthase n=1 Tax=Variovorax brevis TaxID=3053503 RepID=UPI00257880A2|nr:pseudouridine synthase [Variovorax sp. J22R133]MDM0112545.1 pseudouridine synthase [Variovorax sp. J22R133]